MKLYVSSLMYEGSEFDKILHWVDMFSGKLGVEVFTMFHEKAFELLLKACIKKLKTIPVSFHEPYYFAEHTAERGSAEYNRTMEMIEWLLPYMKELNAEYIVFHHNNRDVDKEVRDTLLKTARDNLHTTEFLCAQADVPVAVENAGVGANAMFNEEEFIAECRALECPVLIDVGHAFANGWDIENVIKSLSSQIVSYHIHNNDGVHDSHCRIHDGKMDFDNVLNICKKFTPEAHLVLEYSTLTGRDERGIEEDISFLLERI